VETKFIYVVKRLQSLYKPPNLSTFLTLKNFVTLLAHTKTSPPKNMPVPFFGRRRYHDSTVHSHAHGPSTHPKRHGRGFGHFFQSKDKTRVVAGYSKFLITFKSDNKPGVFASGAALANPNTTREGRGHAKHELHAMVRAVLVDF
jgi:hypothetical protein